MIPAPEPRLSKLYQDVILDHNRKPRNFKEIPGADRQARGCNPLCGDDYRLWLKLDGAGVIQDAGFLGSGCAISKASASLLTTFLKGKTAAEASALKDAFVELLTAPTVTDDARAKVGRLALFEGVKEFPIRVKCATLIWHALADALK